MRSLPRPKSAVERVTPARTCGHNPPAVDWRTNLAEVVTTTLAMLQIETTARNEGNSSRYVYTVVLALDSLAG